MVSKLHLPKTRREKPHGRGQLSAGIARSDSYLFDLCGLNRLRGGANYIEHDVRLGEHGDVTAFNLIRGGAHTLRNKAFQIRVNGAVVLADDVPARLRLP